MVAAYSKFAYATSFRVGKAVEPVSLGTISSVVGFVSSLLSLIMDAVKYFIAYAIFVFIVVVIFFNVVAILNSFDFLAWLADRLARAEGCMPDVVDAES